MLCSEIALLAAVCLAGRPAVAEIPLTEPTLFDTPAADATVAVMQVFPKDNPWNTDVSKWPLHPNSAAIVASIGKDKPLRCNSDMNYVLVPPDQKKVEVAIVGYPDESDKVPYPVPESLPIEGCPAWSIIAIVAASTPATPIAPSCAALTSVKA